MGGARGGWNLSGWGQGWVESVGDDSGHSVPLPSELLLNISAAARRVGVAKDGVHNLTVLLHRPITALRHMTNGESAAASGPAYTCGISGVTSQTHNLVLLT